MKHHNWQRVSLEVTEETQALWQCTDCQLYDFGETPDPTSKCHGKISLLIDHEIMMAEPKISLDEFCNQTVRRNSLREEFRKFCAHHKYRLEQYPAAWRKGWNQFERERETN